MILGVFAQALEVVMCLLVERATLHSTDPQAMCPNKARFPQLKLTTIEDFGGWTTAQATHFKDGGVFDQITAP
jgi:ABC-type sulfate transport system substrate-binding protein